MSAALLAKPFCGRVGGLAPATTTSRRVRAVNVSVRAERQQVGGASGGRYIPDVIGHWMPATRPAAPAHPLFSASNALRSWEMRGPRRAAPSRTAAQRSRPDTVARSQQECNNPGRCIADLPPISTPSLPQVIQPINGDPFIGMLETPVTSSPLVASYLSNLPAYRTGVSPLLRGVEIGLAHGFLLVGPFIKLGPLRNVEGVAEISGCLSAAGLVLILTLCLSAYGTVTFQNEVPQVGVKTLSGRNIAPDALQTGDGWSKFGAGFAVGGLSGVAWGYVCSQILPYYQ